MRSAVGVSGLVVVLVTGCSTPPGPAPSMPAPRIPEEAVAYDDLLSADREFPFSSDCSQVTSGLMREIGFANSATDSTMMGEKAGCTVRGSGDTAFDRFMAEQCPSMVEKATAVLAVIDPGGGSPATRVAR